MSHPRFPEFEYRDTRRVVYGDTGATFVPVCQKCGRYVVADPTIKVYGDGSVHEDEANAECSKDGRVSMIFEGYV